MPIYEYECNKCGHRFEVIQKVSDARLKKCEKCKGKAERLISSPAIQFKGTGWYVTDYAKKSPAPEKDKSSSADDSGGSKSSDSSDASTSPKKKEKTSASAKSK